MVRPVSLFASILSSRQRLARPALRGVALLAPALLAGCASMPGAGGGAQQTLLIDTKPQSVASCTLSNEHGSWSVAQTPAKVTVRKSSGPLSIRCETEDGRIGRGVVDPESYRVFASGLFAGLTGDSVDRNSGLAYRYPEHLRVVLTPQSQLQPFLAMNRPALPLGAGIATYYNPYGGAYAAQPMQAAAMQPALQAMQPVMAQPAAAPTGYMPAQQPQMMQPAQQTMQPMPQMQPGPGMPGYLPSSQPVMASLPSTAPQVMPAPANGMPMGQTIGAPQPAAPAQPAAAPAQPQLVADVPQPDSKPVALRSEDEMEMLPWTPDDMAGDYQPAGAPEGTNFAAMTPEPWPQDADADSAAWDDDDYAGNEGIAMDTAAPPLERIGGEAIAPVRAAMLPDPVRPAVAAPNTSPRPYIEGNDQSLMVRCRFSTIIVPADRDTCERAGGVLLD